MNQRAVSESIVSKQQQGEEEIMQRFMRAVGLAVSASALLVGLAGRVDADITITLDDPNPTVVIPSVGATTIDFTGTVTPSQPQLGGVSFFTIEPSLDSITLDSYPLITTSITDDLINGISFTGLLFEVSVSSSSLPGIYTGGNYTITTPEQVGGGGRLMRCWH